MMRRAYPELATSPMNARFLGDLAPLGALALSAVLIVTSAPTALRVLALIPLLLVPGAALKRLVLGERRRRDHDPQPRTEDERNDGALGLPLAVLLGLVVWLGAALGLHVLRIPLTATSLTVTVAGTAVVLTLVSFVDRRRGVIGAAQGIGTVPDLRRWGAVAAAACVLAGSVALACVIMPVPAERFTLLALADSKPFAAVTNSVSARERVRINWVLRGYGVELGAGLTTVAVRIDGRPVEQVSVDLGPVATEQSPEAVAELAGAVTLTAPATPGRYTVELTVTPSSPDGTRVPPPGPVTTNLEVS